MADQMVTLAEKEAQEKRNKEVEKQKKHEEWRKQYVPLSALFVSNVIFLSLDIRAFQAILILTNSYLLSILTVIISGGLAMYWFDVLYPHSKRHENETQANLAMVSTVLAIGLSGVLAFADYIVGTGSQFSQGWSSILWACVVVLTIYQGVAIAWWWSIDGQIISDARRQKMHAEASDKRDEMDTLNMKLKSLRGTLVELEKLNKDFSPESVRIVAGILGIALPDAPVNQQHNQQQNQPRPAFASEAPRVELKDERKDF